MKKRILAMALTAAMMLSLFPASVFALPESQPTASSSEIVAQLNESASGDSQPAASEKTNSEPTAASEKAAGSEATSSEATSSEAASSEAASSEAVSSEAASSEAASSEPASSEAAQAEGDISVASENGERGMARTLYGCRWVYLYTKIDPSIQISGSEINKDDFYTLGRVKVSVPNPKFGVGPITYNIILGRAKDAAQNGKVERWSKNGSIDLSDVTFTKLKRVEYGATDYVDSGWTWHLDGVLNTEKYGAVTVQHINDVTGDVYQTDTTWYKAGTQLTFDKADAIDPGEGYEFDSLDTKTYTVQAKTSKTITYHYKAKQAPKYSYSVCYVDENSQPILGYGVKNGEAELGSVIEAKDHKIDIPGYVYQKADPEKLTITKTATNNMLTLTYKKCTELVATSINNYPAENIVYDGQEHKWVPTVTDRDGKTLTAGTDYDVVYESETPIQEKEKFKEFFDVSNIKVTITGKGSYTGKVEYNYSITPRSLTVTAASETRVYNGESWNNETYTTKGLVEGEKPKIWVQAQSADYHVTDVTPEKGVENHVFLQPQGNFKKENYNVDLQYGVLIVIPRPVTLTSASDSKTYDGTPLEKHEVNVSKGNFVNGEGVAYKFSGSQKDAGSSDNAYEIDWDKSTAKKDNYKIENKFGTLTINPRTLTITTASASKTYDGNDLTEPNGYSIDGLVKGETLNFSITGRQKEVGSSDNTYVIDWNQSTAKQGNYTIVNKLGKLTVEARSGGSSSGGSSSGGSSSTPTPAPEQAPTPTPVPVIVPAAPTPTPTRVRRVAPAATATPAPTAKPTETIAESEPPKAESEPEVIEDEETPLAPMANGKWALVNLVLMILTVLASLLMLLGVIGKKRGRNNKSFWRIASLIPAIGALAAFVLTENMKLPMAMVDRWTLLMVIIAVLQLIVAAMSKKQNESEDDGANA